MQLHGPGRACGNTACICVADEQEDSKKIQDAKDARDKPSLDMTIRGRLYRIDLVRMEQVLINKMPHLEDSPDEIHGRRREVS